MSSDIQPIPVPDFWQVIKGRRAVRRFTNESIPSTVVLDCLRHGMLAPSASNLQPWRFVVIDRNSPRRDDANRFCLGQNAAKSAHCLILCIATPEVWAVHAKRALAEYPTWPVPAKVRRYYQTVVPFDMAHGVFNPLKAAVTQGVRFARGAMKTPYYDKATRKRWAAVNVALACQNLMLAIEATGYASCPMMGFDEDQLKALIGAKDSEHIVMVVAMGRPAEDGIYHSQYRFDPSDFIEFL